MDTSALVQFLHSDRLVAAPCDNHPAGATSTLSSVY